jgi:hypothetical protein
MKKSRSSDFEDLLNRQYKATLMLVKLTAALSSDITELKQLVIEQNALLHQLVLSDKLEENPV